MCDMGHDRDRTAFGFLVDTPEIRSLIDETQRLMAANPPVAFSVQDANARLQQITDPAQYAAQAQQDMQTYKTQQAARGQAARVSELSPAAGGDALLRNTLLTVYALWWGLVGFALLLVAAIVAALLTRRRLSADAAFFALWLMPAALVYVLIHIGDPGYLMSVLPGLYVACAALVAPIAVKSPRAVLMFAAVLVAIGVGVFVAADTPFSAQSIASHDRSLEGRVAFIRGRFPPATTVILAQSEYLTARYYLPEYRVLFFGPQPDVLSRAAQEIRVSATTVVVFGALGASSSTEVAARLHTGDPVLWGDIDAGSALVAYELEPR